MSVDKFIIIFLLFLAQVTASPNPICTSVECHQQASSVLNDLDTSVSPCDDFYQFSCGNFKFNGTQLGLQQEVINKQLIEIFSEQLSENDDKILKLVKTFYQSCINDRESLDDYVKGKLLPAADNPADVQHDEGFSWENFIQDFQFFQYEDAYIFQLDFELVDDEFFLIIDQPIKRSKEVDTSKIDFVVSLGLDRDKVEKIATQAAELNGKISEVLNSEKTKKTSALQEFLEIFTFIDLIKFLSSLFLEVDIPEKILVRNLQALKKVNDILVKTSTEVIESYITWAYIESVIDQWHKEDEEEESRLTKTEQKSEDKSKIKSCYRSTIQFFSVAAAEIYVRNFNDEQTNAELEKFIESIKQNLLESFHKNDWLDDATRMRAVDKLNKMKFLVGYPKMLNNQTAVEEYYGNLKISRENFTENLITMNVFDIKKLLYFSITVTDPEETIMYAVAEKVIETNAGYSFTENTFFIFNGIIYNKTFSTSRPNSMNYGAIGSVIAHEILHGFDNEGRLYDENGEEMSWWTKEAEEAFLEKSLCFIDQYGNYTEPVSNLRVNGTLTLGENIADNGGFVTAYHSYQNWLKTNKVDQILPYLNFTANQLFWISNAKSFCSKHNIKVSKWLIENDEHSPDRFRINGVMGNSEEFMKDFQCPENSAMNRKNKCKVW